MRTIGATGGFTGVAASGGGAGAGSGCDTGGAEHEASTPRIAATASALHFNEFRGMWLILLEALGALLLIVFIVWWTMFSGRPRGELPAQPDPSDKSEGR